jgi:hypothetical protein
VSFWLGPGPALRKVMLCALVPCSAMLRNVGTVVCFCALLCDVAQCSMVKCCAMIALLCALVFYGTILLAMLALLCALVFYGTMLRKVGMLNALVFYGTMLRKVGTVVCSCVLRYNAAQCWHFCVLLCSTAKC